MWILGISAFYHDSAAALLHGGRIVAAAQEERFSRKRHDDSFPSHAIDSCLTQAGITLRDVTFIAFYDKPLLKFERLLHMYLTYAPKGFASFSAAMPEWIFDKLFLRRLLLRNLRHWGREADLRGKLLFSEHHLSHAASAFFPSPFDEAAILTMDGVGEWTTTSIGYGRGSNLEMQKEIHFPHSLGLLYSAFTYYTGFKVNSGEYKVMGLAPYGEPRYADVIREHLIDIKEDGTFRLNMEYFDYCTGLTMVNERFERLLGGPRRKPDDEMTQRVMDLASSIQAVTEEVVLKLCRSIARESGSRNLCLAGGVALNCVANGKVLRERLFDRVWIQPAAGDAGGALGTALAVWHLHLNKPRVQGEPGQDSMRGAYLGPEFSQGEIERRLNAAGATFEALDGEALIDRCVKSLIAKEALGWFQGRMEFGPRALGARSILGDARSARMQSILNLKVKYRESFRPFAPAVLREDVGEWFDLQEDSPYMLLVADVARHRRCAVSADSADLFGIEKLKVRRSTIPAVTHVDYSARIQTVHRETNPRFYRLLKSFKAATHCPVLVNTSFNVRGEPIVNSPEDALRCFMGTEIEALAIGNCFLRKEDQDPKLRVNYRNLFAPD
jgi:carbamoyltransferase